MDERDLLTLNAYIDGELAPGETRAFESRLAMEPELTDELARTRATVALLGMAEPLRAPHSFALDPAVYGTTEQPGGGLLSWLKPRGTLRPVLAGASLLTSLVLFGAAFLGFAGDGMMPTAMDAAPAMESADRDYAQEESMAVEPQAAPMTSVAEAPVQPEIVVEEAEEPMAEEAPAEEEMAEEAEMPADDMAADSAAPAFTAMPTPLATQPITNDSAGGGLGSGAGDAAAEEDPAEPLSDRAPVPEVAEGIAAEDDGDMRTGDSEEPADISNGNTMTFGEDGEDGEAANPAADTAIDQQQAVLDLEDDIQRSMRRSIALSVIAIITAVIGVTLLITPRQQAIE